MKSRLQRIGAALAVIALSALGIRHLVGLWQHAHDVEVTLLALRPVLGDPETRELERDWGFSQIDSRYNVQVSPAEDPSRSHRAMWSAYEVDRRADEPALAPGARGVVIAWEPGDALSYDPLNHSIPIERLARTSDEIAWIAFSYRSTIRMYAVGTTELRSERIDMRVVRRDQPGLLGRLTAEGIPPQRVQQSDINRVHGPSAATVGSDLVALLDDTRVAVEEPAPSFPTECFADSLPRLGPADEGDYTCIDGATDACLHHCRSGEAGSCLAAAYALNHGWWHRPDELYRLACIGGSSSGCTNYGAAWLVSAAPDDALATSCTLALFERACAAEDPYACGMVGRVLARSGADAAAIRARMEGSCSALGYFACESLARMIEDGNLGPVDDAAVLRAREHACDTGYAPACAALPEPRPAPPPSVPRSPSTPTPPSDTLVHRRGM